MHVAAAILLVLPLATACGAKTKSAGSTAAPTATANASGSSNAQAAAAGPNATVQPTPVQPTPLQPAPLQPAVTVPGWSLFLSAADIAAPTGAVHASAAADEMSQLVGENDFYDNKPPPAAGDNAVDCFSSMLGSLVYKATNTTLIAEQTFDMRSCWATLTSGPSMTTTYNTASVHVAFLFSCSGGGLAKYDGFKQSQLAGINMDPCDGTELSSTQIKLAASGTFMTIPTTGTTGTAAKGTLSDSLVVYVGTPDLSPCSHQSHGGSIATATGCESLSVHLLNTKPDGTAGVTNTYYKNISLGGIVKANDGTTVWPSSGTAQVTLNNWTGSVTYAGPATPPSYHLTASDGSVLNGQFPAP